MSQPGSSHSPIQDGFNALWHEPMLLLAELTWRWCFGFSAWALTIISAGLFLDSLKISAADQFLLETLQPQLLAQALRHVFRGSLTRFALEGAALVLGLTLLWSLAAAAGRGATLHRLVAMFSAEEESETTHWEFTSIFVLQLLRSLWTLIALGALISCLVLGVATAADDRPGRAALLLSFGIGFALAFGWILNWFFGVAPLFCIRSKADAMQGVVESVDFAARVPGRLSVLALVFGTLRLVWAGTMFLAVLAPIKLVGHIAPGWVMFIMAVIALVYFAVADLLRLARLGAYASLAENDSRPTGNADTTATLPEIPTPAQEFPPLPEPAAG